MDECTLDQRTKTLLHLLATEDPKYPKRDCLIQLLNLTKECLARKATVPNEITDERALRIITGLAGALVRELEAEQRWPELIGGWYSSDIFEVLSWRVLGSILPHMIR